MIRYLLSSLLLLIITASLHASVAKVTSLNGTATIERGSKSLSATLGSDLESKDTITTNASSKAQLTFKDNTIITVGKQSRFSIEEYLFDASDSSNAKFNVISGTVRAMSGKIGKIAPDKFMVKTKTATIGIRGTDFVVHVADDGTISIFCLQGSIIVRDANGNEVIVNAGSYVTLTPTGTIDGPHEFTATELNKLLENGFFIPYVIQNNQKIDFSTNAEPILAADGTGEILHPDESLERGNIPNVEEVLADAGITITTDSISLPAIATDPQIFTGFTTFLDRPQDGSYVSSGSGTLTITSVPTTQSVSGTIDLPSVYKIINLGSTNSYSTVDSFDVKLASIEMSGIGTALTPTSHIWSASDTQNDYFSWGEWSIDPNPIDPSDNIVHGYWAAGVETPTTILDGFRSDSVSMTYSGNVIGEVQKINSDGTYLSTAPITSGTSNISVNFGADTFNAVFSFSALDSYVLSYTGSTATNKLQSSSLTGLTTDTYGNLLPQSPYGTVNGGFYGSNGKMVGGIFNADSALPSPPANGETIKIQGAFKATAP